MLIYIVEQGAGKQTQYCRTIASICSLLLHSIHLPYIFFQKSFSMDMDKRHISLLLYRNGEKQFLQYLINIVHVLTKGDWWPLPDKDKAAILVAIFFKLSKDWHIKGILDWSSKEGIMWNYEMFVNTEMWNEYILHPMSTFNLIYFHCR